MIDWPRLSRLLLVLIAIAIGLALAAQPWSDQPVWPARWITLAAAVVLWPGAWFVLVREGRRDGLLIAANLLMVAGLVVAMKLTSQFTPVTAPWPNMVTLSVAAVAPLHMLACAIISRAWGATVFTVIVGLAMSASALILLSLEGLVSVTARAFGH